MDWKEIAWGGTEYIGTKIGKSALDNIYDEPAKIIGFLQLE